MNEVLCVVTNCRFSKTNNCQQTFQRPVVSPVMAVVGERTS